jgi:hypothetical protein
MRTLASVFALTFVGLAAPESQTPDQPQPSASLERLFVPNGRVTMHLSAGEYRIEGTRDNRIRAEWSAQDGARLSEVRAQADVRASDATLRIDGPDEGHVKSTIQVPQRVDLFVRLSAGVLAVEDVQGNKDIRLHAGEMRIDVGRPVDYQHVRASVWVGNLNAEPFAVRKGGFFRSFNWTGRGPYQLRARLKTGDLQLYSKTPK